MITASHLPYDRNGVKFFTSSGGLAKADIARILEVAQKGSYGKFKVGGGLGSVSSKNLLSAYAVSRS